MFSWGTNSMGQCGQGHSNSSVTKPGKVHGLDRVQVQQISAGTSHSIVWTAMPMGRQGKENRENKRCKRRDTKE